MRLKIVIAIMVLSAPLLAGCFTAESWKPLTAHGQQCEQLGFKQGTPEHANCRLELARRATPRGATPATPD